MNVFISYFLIGSTYFCFFSKLFNNKPKFILVPSGGHEDAHFGYDFYGFANKQNVGKRFLIGAPKDLCHMKNRQENCGALYSCEIDQSTLVTSCSKKNEIYDYIGYENLFHNDMLGYHVSHYDEWGTLVCAPLKRFLSDGVLVWKGWCGRLDIDENIVSHQIGDGLTSQNTTLSTKDRHSFGYSSCYFDQFASLAISDPVSLGGRGRIKLFDEHFNMTSDNTIGYFQYSYTGVNIRKIHLENNNQKTYFVTSAETKTGRTIQLLELRKNFYNKKQVYSILYSTNFNEMIRVKNKVNSQTGFDFLCSDIDGDGWEDIVVSSPYDDDGKGVVSLIVSKNKKGLFKGFEQFGSLVGDSMVHSLFGYSMSLIGDANQDSIQDLAISSPFGSDGGAVYIYLSSPSKGFIEPYFQKISAASSGRKVYSSFGMKLKSHFSTTGEGDINLAISSPFENEILIYDSNLLFIISFTIDPSSKNILSDEIGSLCPDPHTGLLIHCRPFKFCLEASYKRMSSFKKQLYVNVNLEIDRTYKRAIIILENNHLNANLRISEINNQQKCMSVIIGVEIPFTFLSVPLTLTATYGLIVEGDQAGETVSPIYANANPFDYEYYFLKDCKNSISCYPNLKLEATNISNVEENFIFGKSAEFDFFVTITSLGETAYDSLLIVNISQGYDVSAFKFDKWQLKDSYILTSEGSFSIYRLNLPSIMKKGDKINLKISFMTNEIISRDIPLTLNVTAYVKNDTFIEDNTYFYEFKQLYQSEMELYSFIKPYQIKVTKSEIDKINNNIELFEKSTPILTYFNLQNRGPSPAHDIYIAINVQTSYNGSPVLYFTGIEVNKPANCRYEHIKEEVNKSTEKYNLETGSPIILEINCSIHILEKGDTVTLKLETLLSNEIIPILEHQNNIFLSFYGTVKRCNLINLKQTLVISKVLDSHTNSTIPVWVIILSVCIGGAVLAVFIVVIICVQKKRKRRKVIINRRSYQKLLSISRV